MFKFSAVFKKPLFLRDKILKIQITIVTKNIKTQLS